MTAALLSDYTWGVYGSKQPSPDAPSPSPVPQPTPAPTGPGPGPTHPGPSGPGRITPLTAAALPVTLNPRPASPASPGDGGRVPGQRPASAGRVLGAERFPRRARDGRHAPQRAGLLPPGVPAEGSGHRAGVELRRYRWTVLVASLCLVVGVALVVAGAGQVRAIAPLALGVLFVWQALFATPGSLWPKRGAR